MAVVEGPIGYIIERLFIGCSLAAFVICQFWSSIMFSPTVVGMANAVAGGWGNAGESALPLMSSPECGPGLLIPVLHIGNCDFPSAKSPLLGCPLPLAWPMLLWEAEAMHACLLCASLRASPSVDAGDGSHQAQGE